MKQQHAAPPSRRKNGHSAEGKRFMSRCLKKPAAALVCTALLLSICTPGLVLPAGATEVTSMADSYTEVLNDLIARYGICRAEADSDGFAEFDFSSVHVDMNDEALTQDGVDAGIPLGLAYADLIDFNSDGIPELYLQYLMPVTLASSSGELNSPFQAELWSWNGSSAEKTASWGTEGAFLDSMAGKKTDGESEQDGYIYQEDGMQYLVNSSSASDGSSETRGMTVRQVSKGKLTDLHSIEERVSPGTDKRFKYSYTLNIDGKDVRTWDVDDIDKFSDPEAVEFYRRYDTSGMKKLYGTDSDTLEWRCEDTDPLLKHLSSMSKGTAPFWDVTSNRWFAEAVSYVSSNGVMNGTSAVGFSPDTVLSRNQICQLLYNLEGSPAVSGSSSFQDVPGSSWYSKAVNWAAQKGLVSGVGKNRFDPKSSLTREQLASILYRYSKYKGFSTSETASLDKFPDASSVGGWAREAVQWAVASGLIAGTTGSRLLPKGSATRAEAASLFMRFCQEHESLIP